MKYNSAEKDSHLIFKDRKHRGVTLLLTLIVLAITTTALGHWATGTTAVRMAALSQTFATEAQWAAQGVAEQWSSQSHLPDSDIDKLLAPCLWRWENWSIQVVPSSCQNKLHIGEVAEVDWVSLWRLQTSSIQLVPNPGRVLLEQGTGALEVILGPKHLSAQEAYEAPAGEAALHDIFTVWGNGKVDVNRCARPVLLARLKGFTEAQVDGLLRLRQERPIQNLSVLTEPLSLAEDQSRLLAQVATTQPECLELLIRVSHSGMTALYHAVIRLDENGEVLELRALI